MGLNWKQFEFGVLRPTAAKLHPIVRFDEVPIRLVGETIWHESDRLQALGQYPRGGVTAERPFGPGLGLASIEQPTWDWLYGIHRLLGRELGMGDRDFRYDELAWNLALNVVGCRLRYFVDRRALPTTESGIEGRARYWFLVYNASGVDSRRVKYIADAKQLTWK
jgi:hypothetical protein